VSSGKVRKLGPGDLAPDFELPDQHGRIVRLRDYRGRKVLIFFYPRAMTPGCTRQACSVRDARNELDRYGIVVLGISPDPPERQKRFDEQHGPGFPLLADTQYETAKAWGIWGGKKLYGKTFLGVVRSAFLVGEDGRIAAAWYKIRPPAAAPEVLRAILPGPDRSHSLEDTAVSRIHR